MGDSQRRIESVEDLRPGDHICCIYDTEEQRSSLLATYVREGLSRNHKVLYIVDVGTEEELVGYLQDEGIDASPLLESGQITITEAEEAYARSGRFDPDGMIEFLRSATTDAVEDGYSAMRVTGEMSWALQDLPGSERLIEYETRLNEFIRGSDCIAMGLYDSRLFPPKILINILQTHPIAVVGNLFFDNFYYVPPEDFLSARRSARIYEQWIGALESYDHTRRELEESERSLKEMFDSSLVGITITAADGTYFYANRAAAGMLGYEDPNLMTGRNANDHYASEDLRSVLLQGLREQGSLKDFETTARRLDGSIFPVRLSATFKKDGEGNMESITTFFNDTTEQKIQEELEMIRTLSAYVLAEKEKERKEIARDIHDQLGQSLSGMKIHVGWLLDNLPEGRLEATEKLLELRNLIEESFDQMHDLVSRLRPVVLDRLGLGAALEWLCENLKSHYGIDYEVNGDLETVDIDSESETVAFRIVQESLNNVVRHSGASRVVLTAERDDSSYMFSVADNGKGIEENEKSGALSMGILGMRERARTVGGKLVVEGGAEGGTRVTLKLPALQRRE